MAGGALPGGATRNGGLRFSASAKRGRSGAATGGGGDMTVDNTSFASGQAFTVTGFTLTDGNA